MYSRQACISQDRQDCLNLLLHSLLCLLASHAGSSAPCPRPLAALPASEAGQGKAYCSKAASWQSGQLCPIPSSLPQNGYHLQDYTNACITGTCKYSYYTEMNCHNNQMSSRSRCTFNMQLLYPFFFGSLFFFFFLPAGHTQNAWSARPKMTVFFASVCIYICICVCTIITSHTLLTRDLYCIDFGNFDSCFVYGYCE